MLLSDILSKIAAADASLKEPLASVEASGAKVYPRFENHTWVLVFESSDGTVTTLGDLQSFN